jgi:hypothetical protein
MWTKQFIFRCVEVSGAEIYRVSEPDLTLEFLFAPLLDVF